MAEKTKRVDIGGQAVMEGVMMKSPDAIGIAVRREDGQIVRSYEKYQSPAKKHKWMGWPIIRGVVNMVQMMTLGIKTLDKSTQMLGVMQEEPTKFEKWLSKVFGKDIEKVVMGVAMVLALGLSLLLFMVIPNFVASMLNRVISSLLVVNLCAGVVRIAILMGYIWLCGLIPDMRRVFMYHGAEHKTVYCHEAGLPLTPDNAKQFSRLHPRCGTSFLLLVMIISILMGAISDQLIHLIFGIERMGFALRLLRSLILLPLISGVSYEALKGLAHKDNALVRALRWPGLQMQRLTTREPDAAMLEVAIDAMNTALNGLPVTDTTPTEPVASPNAQHSPSAG